jgi:hypothetical protein
MTDNNYVIQLQSTESASYVFFVIRDESKYRASGAEGL